MTALNQAIASILSDGGLREIKPAKVARFSADEVFGDDDNKALAKFFEDIRADGLPYVTGRRVSDPLATIEAIPGAWWGDRTAVLNLTHNELVTDAHTWRDLEYVVEPPNYPRPARPSESLAEDVARICEVAGREGKRICKGDIAIIFPGTSRRQIQRAWKDGAPKSWQAPGAPSIETRATAKEIQKFKTIAV